MTTRQTLTKLPGSLEVTLKAIKGTAIYTEAVEDFLYNDDRKIINLDNFELAHPPDWNGHGGTIAELMTEDIEPVRFVVDGLVPEGLTMLAGKPKLGKSWLALSMSLSVCAGHDALNHRTTAGETLYVSLEDGKRRLQDRVRILDGHHLGEALRRLHYRTEWPALTSGGLDHLESWMSQHPETRLIVIDTWARMRGDLPGKDRYAEEYNQLGVLQSFATKHRVAVVLVHHLRKQGADDWLEQLSGSQAVTATADTLLGLFRERGQMDATLRLVSREVDEKELALKFDGGRWTTMGDAFLYRQTVERTQVLEALGELEQGSASEIALLVGKTPANVSYLLRALHSEGLIKSIKRGVYAISPLTNSLEVLDSLIQPSSESSQSSESRGGLMERDQSSESRGSSESSLDDDLVDPW